MITKKLVTSLIVTVLLLYFMIKSPSPEIIFIPFLICSISMAIKNIARMMNKEKVEVIFGKIFTLGFLLFLIGFLVFVDFTAIRDENYSLLIFSIPFWIVGFFLIKKRLLKQKEKKSGESFFTFAFVISAILVVAALLVGIVLLVLGFKDLNIGLIFGGIFFTFGSLVFVLAALKMKNNGE